MATDVTADKGISVVGPDVPGADRVLTPDALAFVADLHRRFNPTRQRCSLRRSGAPGAPRRRRACPTSAPTRPTSAAATGASRRAPADLDDRRVEITGPAEPKMMINALNTRRARLHGRPRGRALANVGERRRRPGGAPGRGPPRADVHAPEGKAYRLNEKTATLVVRPRGWHLTEAPRARRRRADLGVACSTSGSTSSTTPRELVARGSGPYFYLPKLEATDEARLWNDVFVAAQDALELSARHHPRDGADRDDPRRVRDGRDPVRAARACGGPERRPLGLPLQPASRSSASRPDLALPDRAQLTMTTPFMRAYTELLVQTCHAAARTRSAAWRRSSRAAATRRSTRSRMARVARRQASASPRDGFDGTWVAHPDLVPLATEIFDGVLGDAAEPEGAAAREEVAVTAAGAAEPARRGRADHRGRRPGEHHRRAPVPRRLAGRQRRRRDQQPDGGRRDGRDQPVAALAVANDPVPAPRRRLALR